MADFRRLCIVIRIAIGFVVRFTLVRRQRRLFGSRGIARVDRMEHRSEGRGCSLLFLRGARTVRGLLQRGSRAKRLPRRWRSPHGLRARLSARLWAKWSLCDGSRSPAPRFVVFDGLFVVDRSLRKSRRLSSRRSRSQRRKTVIDGRMSVDPALESILETQLVLDLRIEVTLRVLGDEARLLEAILQEREEHFVAACFAGHVVALGVELLHPFAELAHHVHVVTAPPLRLADERMEHVARREDPLTALGRTTAWIHSLSRRRRPEHLSAARRHLLLRSLLLLRGSVPTTRGKIIHLDILRGSPKGDKCRPRPSTEVNAFRSA